MPKKPAKLKRVLFVCSDAALLAALDREVKMRRKANPGRRVSRSDAARELLWAALEGGLL